MSHTHRRGGNWDLTLNRSPLAPDAPPGRSCDPFHPMKSHPFQGPLQGLQQGPDCNLLLRGPTALSQAAFPLALACFVGDLPSCP